MVQVSDKDRSIKRERERKALRVSNREKLASSMIQDQLIAPTWSLKTIQLLGLLSVFVICVIIIFLPIKPDAFDRNFYSLLLSSLLTLGTFVPAFILTLVNRIQLKVEETRLIWLGITKFSISALGIFWLFDFVLVTLKLIELRAEPAFLEDYGAKLTLGLTFSIVLLIPVVVAILQERLRPKKFGSIALHECRKLLASNKESHAERLVEDLLASTLKDATAGDKVILAERFVTMSNLALLNHGPISKKVFEGFGWIAQESVSNREIVKEIINHLDFLVNQELSGESKEKLRDDIEKELWSIFDEVVEKNASGQILNYVIEVLHEISEGSRIRRARYLLRFALAGGVNQRKAGFVQKWTFEWLSKMPELLNEARTRYFLNYLEGYDWSLLEVDSRSFGFGASQASALFEECVGKYRSLPKYNKEVLSQLTRISRDLKRQI